MLTVHLELSADLLKIGVRINTNLPDIFEMEFFKVVNERNGEKKRFLSIEGNAFEKDFLMPFLKAVINVDPTTHFEKILLSLTGDNYELDIEEAEEFREFIQEINLIGIMHAQRQLPWQVPFPE